MNPRPLLCGLLAGCLSLPAASAQEKKEVAPGTEVNVIVKPAEPSSPPITLKVNGREGKAVPLSCGFVHTAGGNIDVQQPTPDVILITVTGVAVAGGHPCKKSNASLHVDLNQCFDVVFDKTDLKNPRLTLEGRVIGVLRSHCAGGGCASESAEAAVAPACGGEALTIQLPSNTVCKGENRSINDHEGPVGMSILPGKYVLHAHFDVSATHPVGITKAASAEFAPDALDPIWISYKEPFHGIAKKDFGFQITIKVLENPDPLLTNGKEEEKADGDKKPEVEKLPPPKP